MENVEKMLKCIKKSCFVSFLRHNTRISSLKAQKNLNSTGKLTDLKEGHVIAVFPDQSDRFWGGIVTQVCQLKTKQKVEHQKHQPLVFL